VELPAWVTFCELAEMWHTPPWELEKADDNGDLLQWGMRAMLWRSTKNKKQEIRNG